MVARAWNVPARLDLGADDVVSFPFEPLEFAAKIRTQIRERQPELELEARMKDALQKEHLAEIAVEALSGGHKCQTALLADFCSTWLQRSSGCRIARHSCFEPAQPQGYAPTQSGGSAAETADSFNRENSYTAQNRARASLTASDTSELANL